MLKVSLLQTDIAWADSERNILAAERLIRSCDEADLYVLPEMWSTGFATDPREVAQPESQCDALLWMRQTAADRQCAICGSLAVRADDGTWRNRHYFADGRSRQLYYYDKHHLFTYGGEHQYYTPGDRRCIVSYGGVRLLLLTCYDLRFPCWCRYADGAEYDVIVVVANWPQRRQPVWQLLTRARAIENQCYLVGVNRVGTDPYSQYAGASVVCDLNGRTLLQCRRDEQQAAVAQLDLDWMQRQRARFHALDDRDRG